MPALVAPAAAVGLHANGGRGRVILGSTEAKAGRSGIEQPVAQPAQPVDQRGATNPNKGGLGHGDRGVAGFSLSPPFPLEMSANT